MKKAILCALESDLKRKQKRIVALGEMMKMQHLKQDDCAEWDRLAVLFNTASGNEKMDLAEQMTPIGKRIDDALKKMKHQNENYQAWMTEQHLLMLDASELKSEIAAIRYYEAARKDGGAV